MTLNPIVVLSIDDPYVSANRDLSRIYQPVKLAYNVQISIQRITQMDISYWNDNLVLKTKQQRA